jgi:leucyl-tRNA synthetase
LTSKDFVHAKCPKCGSAAKRETDTMDTFFDSSWYFLRYADSKNENELFDKNKVKYWLPVDQYIGGAEHACMHLVYARFFTKALRDMGYLNFDEPFLKLFNQGMLHGPDGHVMSKSRGNVVLPETISEKYSIDTARFFLLSIAGPDKDLEWSDSGIEGSFRFVKSVISYFENVKIGKSSKKAESKLNKTIKEVTEDIENFKYNIAIIKLRKLFETLEEYESRETLESFLKLLHPICPHITEELWEKLGKKEFLTISSWPKADESKIDEGVEFLDEVINGSLLDVKQIMTLAKVENPKKIVLIVADEWKYSFLNELTKLMEKTRNQGEIIKEIMSSDLKKHGQSIVNIVQKILKDSSKMPRIILSQNQELEYLKSNSTMLKKEFDCEILVLKESESKEQKAKNAMPGKPAIVVE